MPEDFPLATLGLMEWNQRLKVGDQLVELVPLPLMDETRFRVQRLFYASRRAPRMAIEVTCSATGRKCSVVAHLANGELRVNEQPHPLSTFRHFGETAFKAVYDFIGQ